MKRVAICFYGQVRMLETFHIYWGHYESSKEYVYDFFIATWNDFRKDLLHFDFKKSKFIDSHIDNRWNTPHKLHKPVFLLREVLLLKQEYEIVNGVKYDAILVTRPDIIFNKKILLEEIDYLVKFPPSKPTIQFFQKTFLSKDQCWKIELEGGFLATPDSVDTFTGLYTFLTNKKYLDTPYRFNKDVRVLNFAYLIFSNYHSIHINPSKLVARLLRPNRDIPILKEFFTNKFDWKSFDHTFHKNFHPVPIGHTKPHPSIKL